MRHEGKRAQRELHSFMFTLQGCLTPLHRPDDRPRTVGPMRVVPHPNDPAFVADATRHIEERAGVDILQADDAAPRRPIAHRHPGTRERRAIEDKEAPLSMATAHLLFLHHVRANPQHLRLSLWGNTKHLASLGIP